jgi:hypothetical protein
MLRSLRVQLKKRCNRVNASLLDAVFYDIDDDAKESSGYLLCYTKISLDIHNNANAFGRFALGMTSAYVRTILCRLSLESDRECVERLAKHIRKIGKQKQPDNLGKDLECAVVNI